jgi:hypothetical protein
MGNSLLGVNVFGRRAGRAAGERARSATVGKLTLAHLDDWERQIQEAGLEAPVVSPLILPDYTRQTR